MSTEDVRERAIREFSLSCDGLRVVAKRCGLGRDKLTKIWKEEFGPEAFKARADRIRGLARVGVGKSGDPEIRKQALLAFETEEPMKKTALRLGVHYTVVREWWNEKYGAKRVTERGRQLQLKRTQENSKTRSKPVFKKYDLPCEQCGTIVTLNNIALTKRGESKILCQACTDMERGADQECPICNLRFVGKKGLAHHFAMAHADWVEVRKKEKLGVEGVDHILCLECGYRSANLLKHLETAHHWTPTDYLKKYPGVRWRTETVENRWREAHQYQIDNRESQKGKKRTKSCPECGQQFVASLFAVEDTRCDECKAEEALFRWVGKKEPEDFVSCRLCGHRAEFLLSHIRMTHDYGGYLRQFPDALLTSLNAGQRLPSNNKLVLAQNQLQPFMDGNGHVIAAAAATFFNCAQSRIRRICSDFGLKTRSRIAWQKAVLDIAADHLQEAYEPEFSDERIVSFVTGRMFRFDGYFPRRNLLLEAHGNQHFYFVASWHQTRERFEELQALDRAKVKRAQELGYDVKIVRYNDPIHDSEFWRKLFSNDSTLWVNKPEDLKKKEIDQVRSRLRKEGFPKILPSDKTTAEQTKLARDLFRLDEFRVIRPHTSRGTTVCASYFPNRYRARHRMFDNVENAWNDDKKLNAAIRIQLNAAHPTTSPRVLRALQMICRTPTIFRPGVAKYIYDTHCPSGGVVWDPCAGYGGRLFGAMASGVGKYIGTDAEPETVEGNRRLAEALDCLERCDIQIGIVEEFDPGCDLDLVFTSPPYYDLEVYGEGAPKYAGVTDWMGGFLKVLIEKAKMRLKPGGWLVLNLPSKKVDGVDVANGAARIAHEMGFRVEEPVFMPIRSKRIEGKSEPLIRCRV